MTKPTVLTRKLRKTTRQQIGRLELEVDQLEQRRMLAGDVTTSLSAGSLTISGDAQDNVLAMTQVNGELALIGIDTAIEDADISTSIDGIDLDIKFIDGVTKDVLAILRGGDDTFLLGGSIDGIEFGDTFAGEELSFGPASLPRDLKIWTNGGRDTVVVTGAEIGRDLSIDTGFGLEDTVVIGGGGVAMAVLDAIQDVDLFTTSALGFDGDDGLSDVVGEIINAFLGPVDVGRNLFISGESSNDAIYVGGADVGRDATIFTNIGEDNVYFGTGAVIEIFDFDFDPTAARVSNWLEEINVSSFVSVGRNTNINTGDGDDVARIGGAVEFELFIDGGGEPSATQGYPEYVFVLDGGVEVENNFTLNTANNDDLAYVGVQPRMNYFPETSEIGSEGGNGGFYDVIVGNNMNLLTGGDDDLLQIGGSDGEVFDDCICMGPEGVLEVGRNLYIDTGAGTDDLLMGETETRTYDPQLAAGDDNGDGFYLIDVGNNLTILTGSHDDNVEIASNFGSYEDRQGGSDGFNAGTLKVGRDMKVFTDGGNDTVSMAYDDFGNDAQLQGGRNEFAIYIGRDLKVLAGDQDDIVQMDMTFVGDDADIRTGWGRDSLEIGNCIGSQSSVVIEDQLKINTDLERDTIVISYTSVGGNSSILTGLRDDDLTIVYSDFGGNLKAVTGSGNDVVHMENVSVDGDIRVLTQSGDDNVDIHNTTASKLFVITSADDDQVCVFDSMFVNGATLNGGRGDFDGLSTNLLSPTVSNFEGPADDCDDNGGVV